LSGYGSALLFDNSVWARLLDGRLTGTFRKTFEAALVADELWTCPPTLLEMRYSARDSAGFALTARRLDGLPHAPMSDGAGAAAVTAQAELAAVAGISHRVKPVDLLIAAIAADHGLGVLHYDHDYDTIERRSGLSFASVWAAPRGSIG
jgi:predicted nucleic acid-binding protein